MFDVNSFVLSMEQEFKYASMSKTIDNIQDINELKEILKNAIKVEMIKQNLINDLVNQLHQKM